MTTIAAGQFKFSQQTVVLLGVGVLAVAGFGIYKVIRKLLNPNEGTAYEGAGVIGTAANLANQTLGGLPEKVGSVIGIGLYDFLHEDPEQMFTYMFTVVPSGQKGVVNSEDLDKNNRFQWKGGYFHLRKDAHGKYFAVQDGPQVGNYTAAGK